ncbi:phage terminase small subunit P27 family [Nonomuraea endophytica]|uniref:phage terminase small subunit P27 family n=1 Tax=Nonomuraea endophytica TaxID=714136 RepID=UPI0037CB0497
MAAAARRVAGRTAGAFTEAEVMMMAANSGRKAAPAGLKLIEGRSAGRDSGGREVKPPPGFRRLPPTKPAELSDDAALVWDELVAELQRLQLLKSIDGPALQMCCEAYVRWCKASAQLADEGMTYTSDTGLRKLNPLVGIVERASAEYRAWAAEFGLTPAAEGKLVAPESGGGEENPYAGTG